MEVRAVQRRGDGCKVCEADCEADTSDLQIQDRPRPRRNQRLSTATTLDAGPQLEDNGTCSPVQAEDVPYEIGETADFSTATIRQITAQVKSEDSNAMDVDIVDLTADDVSTAPSIKSSYANNPRANPASSREQGPYPHFSAHRTAFIFRDSSNNPVRERRLHDCNTVGKLLMQAKAARIVNLKQEGILLSVRINGEIELLVASGDLEDFQTLLHTIKSDRCWRNKSNGAACNVEITTASGVQRLGDDVQWSAVGETEKGVLEQYTEPTTWCIAQVSLLAPTGHGAKASPLREELLSMDGFCKREMS